MKKKLQLKSETIAVLTKSMLSAAVGGISAYPPCDTAGNQSCYMQVCAGSWFPSACSGGLPCDHSGLAC